MFRGTLLFGLVFAVCVSASFAQDGVPSRSKLDKLGLSSMRVASDAQGEEVRGQGFIFISLAVSVSVTDPVTGTTTVTTPFSFASTFGTEPIPSASPLYRQGYAGTTVFDQATNGSLDSQSFTLNPISIDVLDPTGTTVLSSFRFQGGFFANGN